MALDEFVEQGEPFLNAVWIVHADGREAAAQPREMVRGTERRPEAVQGIDRNDLVDAVTEDEPAIEHRDLCVGQGLPAAIEKAGTFVPFHVIDPEKHTAPAHVQRGGVIAAGDAGLDYFFGAVATLSRALATSTGLPLRKFIACCNWKSSAEPSS